MKKILLVILAISLWLGTMGQSTSNYLFSYSNTGSLLDMTGSTPLLTGNNDDATSANFDIGFPFTFMGVTYTKCFATSNGQIRLGTTTPSSSILSSYAASTATLAAMAGDNEVNNGVSYKLTGSAPNRILVIEWNQFYVYYTNITGAGNMQALLYEGTGKIEYIYGEIYNSSTSSQSRSIFISASNTAGKSGSVTVAAPPTYESAATSPTSNLFAASVLIANLASTSQGNRTVYTFTPTYSSTPADPISMTFSGVTNSSMTLNWVDNSVSETYFSVTRALDAGFTIGVVTSQVLSTSSATTGTTYNVANTGLVPGTTYYFTVVAQNEASLPSGALTGNQATNPPATITSAADGLWSSTSTWAGGVVPTAGDNAVIDHNVSVDAATNTCFNLTINSGKTLSCTGTTGVLTVAANLTNNGTLDLYLSPTDYAGLKFTSVTPNTFTSGAGCITDLNTLTIDKGTSYDYILESNLTDLTIKGINTATVGFLTLTNGMLKFSGTNTFSGPVFMSATYSIGANAGLWLNNPNVTVTGQTGSASLTGHLRISDGIFNIGTTTDNSLGFATNARVTIEGGNVVATGRFAVSSSSNKVNYSQSGGSVTVATIGNTSTSYASFDLGTSATSVVSLTGGTITIQNAGSGTTGPRDFRGCSTSTPIPASYQTTLYLGNANSGSTAKTFYLAGNVPPFVISTTSATHKAALSASIYYHGTLTIPTGSDLNLNGVGLWCKGDVVNNGTITGTTASSRFDFSANLLNNNTAQVYTGTDYFGPSATLTTNLSLGINNDRGVTFNGPVNVARVNLFNGQVINANNITIGNGASLACYVQIGVTANTRTGGSFDVSPVFNLGTGTYFVLYEPEIAPRTTGVEIPATRSVYQLSINNSFGVTLTGGDLTITGAGTSNALAMTGGIFNLSGSTLFLTSTAALISGGSPTSFVDGKIVRTYAASRTASGTYSSATIFPIGKGTTYLPVYIDPTTNSGGTVTITGEPFLSNSGSMAPGVNSLSQNRWETLITNGNANLVSTFMRIGDAAILNTDQILQATSASGTYGAIPASSLYASGTPPTLTSTGSQIPTASYSGYFAYGNLTPCTAPTAQPSVLTATYITSTGFIGSFTAASPAPSNYLVVRYPAGSAVTNPVDYTTYSIGAALGLGTVRSNSNATSFTETGLTANTTYDYYIYSYNNSGCYGPVYLIASPLFGSVTTCSTSVGVPGTPTSTNVQANSFTANWTASSTTGVDYLLDVATDATFTNFVTGYNALNVIAALTYPVTGLSPSTPYFVRVRALDRATGCYSNLSGTLSVTTACPPLTAFPYTQNFSATFPSCWSYSEGSSGASYHWEPITSDGSHGVSGPQAGTHFMRLYVYLASETYNPYRLSTPTFTLDATPKRLKYYYFLGTEGYQTTPVPLTLQASTDGGTTWIDLFAHTTTNSTFSSTNALTGWTLNTVDLTSYASQTVAFRFVSNSNFGEGICDQGIDEFTIEDLPSCPEPTGLAAVPAGFQASLSWNQGGGITSWEIEYGATPYTYTGTSNIPGGVTSNNPYILTGLNPTTGYTYKVRAVCGPGVYSAWSAEKTFTTTVACPAPTGPTASGVTSNSAILNWTETGVATAWDIEYGVTPYTFTGTPTASNVSNPYPLQGLLPATGYTFKVRTSCGAGSYSDWSTEQTFTTLCLPITVPFALEAFEGTAFPPVCWSIAVGLLSAPSTIAPTTGFWIQDDWRNVTSPVNKAAKINIYGSGTSERKHWLLAPQIDLGATAGNFNLDFDLALTQWNTSTAPQPGPDDRFAVVLSTDGGVTWTSANTLREWNNTGSAYVYDNINWQTGEHVTIPINGYSGTIMIGFYGESTVSNGDNDLMIDNVTLTSAAPVIPPVVNLTGTFSGTPTCYNATDNIIVTDYTMAAFTQTVTFVAGNYVKFNPQTIITPAAGGLMHAYIKSATMDWCSLTDAPMVAAATGQEETMFSLEQANFTLYPNPTNGNFTLVQKGEKTYGNVKVEVYSMRGDKVLTENMIGEKKHEFRFSDMPNGLYFVKVVAEDYVETIKLVKTR